MEKDSNYAEIWAVLTGVLLATAFLFLAPTLQASPMFRRAPINGVTQTCAKITNNSWTACPSTTSQLGTRQNVYITNATTDTIVGTFDATVAISTGITPIVIAPKWTMELPVAPTIGLYFRSLGLGESNICTEEVTYP